MPEFLKLVRPDEALQTFLAAIPELDRELAELIPSEEALGRVLVEDLIAPQSLPAFDRATVDGYAVRAADTFGASASQPTYLRLTDEVPMGAAPQAEVLVGQAAPVHTGGMLPAGADAVVMIEDTQAVDRSEVEVLKPVAGGQNVIREGEDVTAGQPVISAGVRLRPQEIGGLMALGVTRVRVRPDRKSVV